MPYRTARRAEAASRSASAATRLRSSLGRSMTNGLWVAERLIWLPVFAIMLSGLWLAFRRIERG